MAIKVACVQAHVVFGDPRANACRAVDELTRLKEQGVELAVFPEAFLTGYCFEDRDSAMSAALEVGCGKDREVLEAPKPVQEVQGACKRLGINAVVGFAGRERGKLYNGALLVLADGTARRYMKCHLPELGLDKMVELRDHDLPVFDTPFGKLGILICFDLRIPEASRVLALKGAELIVLPTNWPEGAEVSAEHVAIARAAENRVFVATCNRVGEEQGFRFIGKSKIIDPAGKVLAAAGSGEQTIIADLDLSQARQKRTVVVPGRYETDAFGSRRPELYCPITGD